MHIISCRYEVCGAFRPGGRTHPIWLCLDAQGQTVKTAQVRIRYIEPGHPAKKLDLQSGDIVLRYGDEAITDMIRFNALRNAERPGDPPKTLEIRRGEQPLQIQVPAQGLGWGEKGVWVQNAPSE